MNYDLKMAKIVKRAKRNERVSADGLVLCENCDTPASQKYSLALSWICCAPCATGEADSLNPADFIPIRIAPRLLGVLIGATIGLSAAFASMLIGGAR